ncbi:MAG: hypothetical protein ACREHE_11320 [Rhizomicrobium sp.]
MLGRSLLVLAVLLLVFGTVMHGLAIPRAEAAIAGSNLPAFFGGGLKAFWLNDCADMLILAALLALFAWRPRTAGRATLFLLALLPAAIGTLLYVFLGAFFAAPFNLAIAALVFTAGLVWPKPTEISP